MPQVGALSVALIAAPYTAALVMVAAFAGIFAAVTYWTGALGLARSLK